MRKELLASLSMIGSLAAAGAAAAQTCATPPSCETLGFTKSEADCDGLEALKCPFDQSKLYCPQGGGNMSAAAPGAILYSDGTISDSRIAGKTPIGVVAYVNGNKGFAVALEERNYPWGGYRYDVSCLDDMDKSAASADMKGYANTRCLLNDSQYHGLASYCAYNLNGYLPAAGELKAISSNYNAINRGLQKVSGTQISSEYYWSSSEGYISGGVYAWVVNPSNGAMPPYGHTKDWNNLVRCVLAL